jgi:Zn-dependent protease
MRWSYRILRIAGTDVKVHITFLLLLGFLSVQAYQQGGTPAVAETLALILGIFACVVLHEFGHIFMARHFGVRTPDVILLPIGGVARLERMPDEPRQEFLIALAGPAVTLVIAGGLYGYLRLLGADPVLLTWTLDGASLAAALMQVNVFLLLFNLIPAFPMDGGRVLRSLLAMRIGLPRATRIAASIGQMMAVLIGLYGLSQNAIMLMLIAFFVFIGAGAEVQAVETKAAGLGVRVSDMMMTRFATIPVHARLEQAVRMLLDADQKEFPVLDNEGRVEGILSRDNLIAGLSQRGPQSTVQEAMTPHVPALHPGQSFDEAVNRLKASGVPALPVLDDAGRLVGLLSLENVAELVLVRRAVGERAAKQA